MKTHGQYQKNRAAAVFRGEHLPMTREEYLSARPGDYPGPEEKLVLQLAEAIHASVSTDCAVSWAAQERARELFNEHGFVEALNLLFEFQARRLPGATV